MDAWADIGGRTVKVETFTFTLEPDVERMWEEHNYNPDYPFKTDYEGTCTLYLTEEAYIEDMMNELWGENETDTRGDE